jgi:hypothetical protein
MDVATVEGVLGIAGLIGAGWAVLRAEGLRASVGIFSEANGELRDQMDHLKEKHQEEMAVERERRHEGEQRCTEQIANLTGQLQTLQADNMKTFMSQLSQAVIEVLERDLQTVLRSPRRGG